MLQKSSDNSPVPAYLYASALTPAKFLTFQVLQQLDTIWRTEPLRSLHPRWAMPDYLLCFAWVSNPRGPLEGTSNTCQQDVVIVEYCYTLDLSRPARRVKLQTPPTAQQMDKTGLEWQMLILLSTWLLEISIVVVPNWPMQYIASRTGTLTGSLPFFPLLNCYVAAHVCVCHEVDIHAQYICTPPPHTHNYTYLYC